MRTLQPTSDRQQFRSGPVHRSAGFELHTLSLWTSVLLLMLCIQFASAQSFVVRNSKHLKFPEAEANRIYRSAADAIQQEFQQAEPLRPQFTLVLGAERNQIDVDTKELRLVKWDENLFAKGVVLFSFEQLMPEQRSVLLAERALSRASATVSSDEARTSAYPPIKPPPSQFNPVDALQPQPHPILPPR